MRITQDLAVGLAKAAAISTTGIKRITSENLCEQENERNYLVF